MTLFAEKLRHLREAAGLTQTQLAEKAGMHRQGIAKLERGEREPTWATVQALADALGVSCDVLRTTPPPASEAAREPAAPRGRPRKQAEASEPRTKGKAAGQGGRKRKEKR
jgi:transcriptional regulator with XRE-family HTH domain